MYEAMSASTYILHKCLTSHRHILSWPLVMEPVDNWRWSWSPLADEIELHNLAQWSLRYGMIWLCDAVILFCVHNLQFCVLLFSDSPFKYTGCQTGAALLGSELLQWKQPATQLLALQATPNAQKKWKNISVWWVWFGSRFHGYDLSQPGSSLNLCALSSSSQIRLCKSFWNRKRLTSENWNPTAMHDMWLSWSEG